MPVALLKRWTPEMVLEKLQEAYRSRMVMHEKDLRAVSRSDGFWPDTVGDRSTDYAPEQTRVRGQTLVATMNLEQIVSVMAWLEVLGQKDKRIVLDRLRGHSFRKIGKWNACSRDTIRRRVAGAAAAIAWRLNHQTPVAANNNVKRGGG